MSLVRVVLALLAAALLSPSAALAEPCAYGERLVSAAIPGRVLQGDALRVEVMPGEAGDEGQIRNLQVAIPGVTTRVLAEPDAVVTLAAPLQAAFPVVVSWHQAVTVVDEVTGIATTRACDGVLERVVAGVEAPRLAGSWRILLTPVNYAQRPSPRAWSITPSCTAGVCPLRVGSGAERLIARWAAGWYTMQRTLDRPVGRCRTARRTVDAAFFVTTTTRFKVETTRRAGQLLATKIGGTVVRRYVPTGRGRAAGCRAVTYSDRLVGRLAA